MEQPQQQQEQQQQPQGNERHSGLTIPITTTSPTPFYQPHYNIHQQQQQQQQQLLSTLSPPQPTTTTTTTTTTTSSNGASSDGALIPYPNSTSGTPPGEPQRRKRGRPRKYETPEAAAAARRAALSAPKRKKVQTQPFLSPVKPHSPAPGGQGFTPHIINVADGQDVGQRIMTFLQQSRREMCVLSASGFISYASLRHLDTSGGCQIYEGRFDIISLNGSYVHSNAGGKAGGLSVCFVDPDGKTHGGGVSGPLVAAGPVEVLVATFTIDQKKDGSAGFKGDGSVSKVPAPISTSTPVYRPVVESSGGFGVIGANNRHSMGGSPFMMQPQWRVGIEYDMPGNTTHDTRNSLENGDYEH